MSLGRLLRAARRRHQQLLLGPQAGEIASLLDGHVDRPYRARQVAQWIIDRYPVDEVEAVTGRGVTGAVEVVLPVASQWWLDRLLVRLGPDAEVLEPRDGGDGARRLAADILANYV